MKKFTLGQKLFASFWVIFAIMTAMAAGFYTDVVWLNKTFRQISASFDDVGRFDHVIIEHLRWKNGLLRMLEFGDKFDGNLDPHQCELGKWIDSFKSADSHLRDEWAVMNAEHQTLHVSADRVVALYGSGVPDGARKVFSEETAKSFDKLDEGIRHFQDELRASAKDKAESVGTVVFYSKLLVVVLFSAAVFVGLLVAIFIQREVNRATRVEWSSGKNRLDV